MDNETRKWNRESMVRSCYTRMNLLTYSDLANKAADYFDHNRTMPGEKRIKDVAMAQREAMQTYYEMTVDNPQAEPWRWNRNVPDKYVMDHHEFMSQMAEIAVKDVELHGDSQPQTMTGTTREFGHLLMLRKPESIQENCYMHEFKCQVNGQGKEQVLVFEDTEYGTYKANVPQGFASNHPHMTDMTGVLTAADYSKGKGGQANLLFSIDLMQGADGPFDQSKYLYAELEHDTPDLKIVDEDDFTKAVQSIAYEPDSGIGL